MAKKATPKNMGKVLRGLADYVEASEKEYPGTNGDFCASLNEFLDGLLDDDFFGTEGQLDPRGDQRG